MDSLFANAWIGLSVALLPGNLLMALTGVLLGTLIGVLPGIGPLATMAMLLPVTFHATPEGAIILLAGIYYGAQYGGSTTAILVNMPGETSSAVTCIDGHQMAKQGRAGPALALAAIGSLVGGVVSLLVIMTLAEPLSRFAVSLRPADYFAIICFGLIGSTLLGRSTMLKSVGMILLGVLLGLIGTDVASGRLRFTFGFDQLYEGLEFTAVAVGLFGLPEILRNLAAGSGAGQDAGPAAVAPIGPMMPSRRELRQAAPAMLRGSLIGSVLGILPGGGAMLSSFTSYAVERRLARDPSRFGRGAVEGVAGPETANNAGAQTSFIPMLALGLPSNAIMAILIGALMIQGIAPGPNIMSEQPALIWGLIMSMFVGNVMLVVINLPLIGLWVRLLRTPYRLLFPAIVLMCCIGVYSINSSAFDVVLTMVLGLFGYALLQFGCEPAPLVLGMLLGPMMEENFRRAMQLANGDPTTFVRHPVSLVFLIASVAMLAMIAAPALRRRREEVFQDD
ncbi:MAG: tripartite tricarboxylate transporter permease [Paracoccus sp. (in: a-proteobacteria)]|uniref:tripartite tricarboxylate transporter permease n=1 Tax=Paracoccus sp. TaxID=267 RepID=UPI0039E4CB15